MEVYKVEQLKADIKKEILEELNISYNLNIL